MATNVEMTNLLLGIISVLLTVIGFFMVKFYNRFERLVEEFHTANISIARHEERLEMLEEGLR